MGLLTGLVLVLMMLVLIVLPTGAFLVTLLLVALAATATLALVSVFASPGAEPSPHPPARRLLVPWLGAVFILFLLVTLLPMPLRLSAIGGERRYAQNLAVSDAVAAAESLELHPPQPHTFALTRNRSGTLRWTLMVAAAWATAMLAARLSPRGKLIHVRTLTLLGAAVAVGGIVSLRLAPQGFALWWIYPVPEELPGPLACFRNPNHYAAFLALLCPAALALLLRDLANHRLFRVMLSAATVAALSLGVVLALSRGALIAYAAGLFACTILLALWRRWGAAVGMTLIGATALAAILLVPSPALRQRLDTLRHLSTEDSYQTRLAAWIDSARIARAYPLLGAGANGFRVVYPQHRTTTQGALMTHAENEYVQGVVDLGVLGTLLLVTLLGSALVAGAWPAWRSGGDPLLPVSALGGVSVAAVNALFDYPLHIPLYTLAAASLVGLLLPVPAPSGSGLRPRLRAAAPALVIVAVTLALAVGPRRRLDYDSPAWCAEAPLPDLATALRWAPTLSDAWFAYAERVAQARTPESSLLARQCLTHAAACDPNNYRLWNRIGYKRQELGDPAGAREAFGRVKELRDWMWVPDDPSE